MSNVKILMKGLIKDCLLYTSDACPMGLEPYLLATLSVVKDYERLEEDKA